MVLKLVMPYHSRMFGGGQITRWFKGEGDRIDYGDDLLEFRVDEVRVTKTVTDSHPRRWLEQMARHVAGAAEAPSPAARAAGDDDFESWGAVVTLRVHSSDQGYLRRICAREGDHHEVGSLLALATTEPGEPLDGRETAGAGVLRVVVDMSQDD